MLVENLFFENQKKKKNHFLNAKILLKNYFQLELCCTSKTARIQRKQKKIIILLFCNF